MRKLDIKIERTVDVDELVKNLKSGVERDGMFEEAASVIERLMCMIQEKENEIDDMKQKLNQKVNEMFTPKRPICFGEWDDFKHKCGDCEYEEECARKTDERNGVCCKC